MYRVLHKKVNLKNFNNKNNNKIKDHKMKTEVHVSYMYKQTNTIKKV
jgi:hypothetical protein